MRGCRFKILSHFRGVDRNRSELLGRRINVHRGVGKTIKTLSFTKTKFYATRDFGATGADDF